MSSDKFLKASTVNTTFILLLFNCILLFSCKKEKDIPPIQSEKEFVIFKNQTGNLTADALQAQAKNLQTGATVNFYGTFDASGDPDILKSFSYSNKSLDSTFYFVVDEATGKLSTIYYEVNGIKQPIVIKTEFSTGNDSSYHLLIYDYNWVSNTSELLFETEITGANGVFTQSPVYGNFKVGGISDWKAAVLSVVAGLAIVETGITLVSAVTTATAMLAANWPAVVAAVALTGAIIAAIDIASAAIEDIPYPAGTPVNNPSTGTNDPTPNLTPSPCNNISISFAASMDSSGAIMFYGTAGGQSPYKYSIGALENFQSNEVFAGPYQHNQGYILNVKDVNGCMASVVKSFSSNPSIEYLLTGGSIQTWNWYDANNDFQSSISFTLNGQNVDYTAPGEPIRTWLKINNTTMHEEIWSYDHYDDNIFELIDVQPDELTLKWTTVCPYGNDIEITYLRK